MIQSFFNSRRVICTAFILAGLACLTSCSTSPTPEAKAAFQSIVPKPVNATAAGKSFFVTRETTIALAGNTEELTALGHYFSDKLKPATGFSLVVGAASAMQTPGTITLSLEGASPKVGDEGYELTITEDQVKLTANKAAGLFHGLQTLRQLLPVKIGASSVQDGPWEIAGGTITDYPEYAWRGSMLDVARHFFSVEEVKQYIDYIALYKINTLHLHLSDDQGWRIEIKSWPDLAFKGGSSQVGGGKGGFYTQEQYKDIVAYAQRQYITLIPEIDLPGHINSALASYAELNGGIPIHAEPGKTNPAPGSQEVTPKPTPGVPYTGIEVGFSTLHLEKKATFTFVEDVIRELAAITPGPYLHIGGDEAEVTKKEDYIAFINRFQDIVKANGKKMIGWEEIAQAKIDKEALAQHWHSDKYGQMAVEKGAKLIMSPSKRVYLDIQYDSTTRLGLHWPGYVEVDAAYTWDPATDIPGVGKEGIAGVESALWAETLKNMEDVEYMIFPRMPSAAEVAWTPASERNWETFKVRLVNQGKRWDAMGIKFYRSKKVNWE